MKIINKRVILELKNFLDTINYSSLTALIIGEANYYSNPLPDYYVLNNELRKLPTQYRELFSFLLLGHPLKRSVLEHFWSTNLIEHLRELEIINSDDTDCWMNNLILCSYENCYVFVSNIYYYPTCQDDQQVPYIGPDSYWLTRLITNRMTGKVLELCSGSGIQSIISAKTAASVDCVDLDEFACRISRINTYLNNVDEIVTVHNGNLYSNLSSQEKFDYIISNPPFIPIPSNISFPIAGDGGNDGLHIIRKIIAGLPEYLSDSGTCYITGQLIGNDVKTYLEETLLEHLNNFSINLIVYSKIPIEEQAKNFSILANRINDGNSSSRQWMEIYEKLNVKYIYKFILTLKKGTSKMSKIFINDNWNLEDIPLCEATLQKTTQNYYLNINGKKGINVDEEIADFVSRMDGKKNLHQLISESPLKYKLKYESDYSSRVLSKFCSICGYLERNNVIKKMKE